jgi:hypothetical protein
VALAEEIVHQVTSHQKWPFHTRDGDFTPGVALAEEIVQHAARLRAHLLPIGRGSQEAAAEPLELQGTSRERSGNTQGTLREHSGNIQTKTGNIQTKTGDIQGIFREHSDNLLPVGRGSQDAAAEPLELQGTSRERSGNTQTKTGNIQGIFRES